jgi:hypothetical protein
MMPEVYGLQWITIFVVVICALLQDKVQKVAWDIERQDKEAIMSRLKKIEEKIDSLGVSNEHR